MAIGHSESWPILKDHKKLTDIHRIHCFVYADETARLAATGWLPEDVGKVAFDEDTQCFFILTDDDPVTWEELTNKTIPADLDVKVSCSANDTTAGFLSDKLTESEGTNTNGRPLQWVEINDGGDEDCDLRIDETKIDHDNLQNFVSSEHIDWTQSGAGTIHASNYVDNNDDEKAKVTSNDTTPGYLFDKIQAGTNVSIVENNDGGNETITISTSADITQDCPTLQIRRTTDYTITTSYVDLTFDTTDIENSPSAIEHDNTNTDRVLIKEDGVYLIHIHTQTEVTSQARFDYRVRKNDATVLPGSQTWRQDGGDTFPNGVTFSAELVNGDFLSFQVKRDSGAGKIKANTLMQVTKCQGVKGDKGDVGAGSTINIAEEGSNIANTPHSRLNFIGGDITAVDAGGGTANITISTPTQVFGSEFQESSSDGDDSTTSSSFQVKLSMVTSNLPSGNYRIGYSYETGNSSNGVLAEYQVRYGGTEIALNNMESDNDRLLFGGFHHVNFSGVQTIQIRYRAIGGTCLIRRARLEIWRVS